MANEILSDQNLNQALIQIRQVPSFSGNSLELSAFIRMIKFVLRLYSITDVRQKQVFFSAIEMQISGDAQRTSQLTGASTWTDLMTALISEHKTHIPCEELLRRLCNKPFSTSICKFVEKLESKSFVLSNKLMLENNHSNTVLYTNALNNTVKEDIMRKLPDGLFMTLARHDVSSMSKLKSVAQQEGVNELTFNDRSKSQNNSNQNSQNESSKNKGDYQNDVITPMTTTLYYSNPTSSSKPAENQQAMNEFRQKLRSQNPLNHSPSHNTNAPNPPVKDKERAPGANTKLTQEKIFFNQPRNRKATPKRKPIPKNENEQ